MNIRILNVNPTYQCTSECVHCRYFASPRQKGEYLNAERLSSFLDDLDSNSLEAVCIGGGEPMTSIDGLISLVRVVKRKSHLTAHVITNGSWAVSYDRAFKIAGKLRDVKLDSITLSADGFHQEHIPLEIVVNAARALLDAGIKQVSAGGTMLDADCPSSEIDDVTLRNAIVLKTIPNLHVITGGRVSLVGRAAGELVKRINSGKARKDLVCSVQPWDGGDFSNLQAIMIDNLGYVSTCAGLSIGNVHKKSLSKIIEEYDPKRHKIISILIKDGPQGLLEVAKNHGYVSKAEYVDGCNMCFEARCFLQEMFPDILAPSVCYQ